MNSPALQNAAVDVHKCGHRGGQEKLARTSMTKRAELDGAQKPFWPGVMLGADIPGELTKCRRCRALLFIPASGLELVTLGVM